MSKKEYIKGLFLLYGFFIHAILHAILVFASAVSLFFDNYISLLYSTIPAIIAAMFYTPLNIFLKKHRMETITIKSILRDIIP